MKKTIIIVMALLLTCVILAVQAGAAGTPKKAGEIPAGYKTLSGNVLTGMAGNFYVETGNTLNLQGGLTGNLIVKKGATANIMGSVSGNLTNYGTVSIMGEIGGDLIDYSGNASVMGKVKGKVIKK